MMKWETFKRAVKRVIGFTLTDKLNNIFIGFLLAFLLQSLVYIVDAYFYFWEWKGRSLLHVFLKEATVMLFAFLMTLTLIAVIMDPADRGIFKICSIFTATLFSLSSGYFVFMYVVTEKDNTFVFQYSQMIAPYTLLFICLLTGIFTYLMCNESFFRPKHEWMEDVYTIQEKYNRKKVV